MRHILLLPVVVGMTSGACAPAAINLHEVQRIETKGRFVWARQGQSPTIGGTPVVIEGERLEALVATAQCRESDVMWKGGIPATLVMRDGARVRVDGFSFYGGFLRMSRTQWCDFADEALAEIWETPHRTR